MNYVNYLGNCVILINVVILIFVWMGLLKTDAEKL